MISQKDRERYEEFVLTNTNFKLVLRLLPSAKELCIACAWIGDSLMNHGLSQEEVERISFRFGRNNFTKNTTEIWDNAKQVIINNKENYNGSRKNV